MTPLRRNLFRAAALLGSLVVIAALLETGTRLLVPETTFRVFSNVFARDPTPGLGYTLKRSYTGSAYGVDLVTNSYGFRGREWLPVKAPGTLRIALVGDSHAFGFGVAFEQTMGEVLAARLQARLGRPVEVLNFGVNGYNTRQELAVLEHKVLPLAPDLVLLLTCNNDADAPMWVDSEGFMRWGNEGQEEGTSNIAWDRHQRMLATFQRQALSHSRFLLWLQVQWFRYSMARAAEELEVAQGVGASKGWLPPAPTGPIVEALVEPVCLPIVKMVELCRARGIRFAMLTFEGLIQWRTTLNAVAAHTKVPLLELATLLEGVDSWDEVLRKWSLGWDSHMAAPAQAVWAAGVEAFLLKNDLLQ